VTLTAVTTADSLANQAVPTGSYGSVNYLLSRALPTNTSYLRFSLPAAPAGYSLSSATLQLRTTTDPSAGSNVTHAVSTGGDTWTETGLTWLTRPTTAGIALGTIPIGTKPNQTLSVPLDVAGVVGLLGKQSTLTLSSTGTDGLYVWSRNQATAAYRPQVLLTFR
jgi:hypothetical protein